MCKKLILAVSAFLIGVVFDLPAFALQVRTVSDNGSLSVNISAKELSRIFVENDRISSLIGDPSAYFHKENPESGDVYIQPRNPEGTSAFNIFIGTEQGRHFNLRLKPSDIPADFIEIKPIDLVQSSKSTWEKNTAYTQSLIRLMNAMASGKSLSGYTTVSTTSSSIKGFGRRLRIQIINTYLGNSIRGEMLLVTNLTRSSLSVTETQFYQKGTRAISLKDHLLAPHTTTTLLRVMNNYAT